MNQPIRKNHYSRASLQRPRTARTVLLRMAADEDRATRVRELYETRKAEDPRFTWRGIAEHVGVSERAAHAWGKTGGINPEHLPKLAEILQADQDYIWRGPREDQPTPDLFAGKEQLDGVSSEFAGRVDQVEAKLGGIDDKLDQLNQALRDASAERIGLVDQILALLKQQSELLTRQSELIESLQSAADRLPDGTTIQDHHLVQELRDTLARTAPPENPRPVLSSRKNPTHCDRAGKTVNPSRTPRSASSSATRSAARSSGVSGRSSMVPSSSNYLLRVLWSPVAGRMRKVAAGVHLVKDLTDETTLRSETSRKPGYRPARCGALPLACRTIHTEP